MPPTLIKPIPTQVMNEGGAFGPFPLKDFFQSDNPLTFHAELSGGEPLPQGLICTADGMLTGIPAKDTQGNHEVRVSAESTDGKVQADFFIMIKPAPVSQKDANYINALKAQIWEALEHRLPLPDLDTLYEYAITDGDIAYMLDRWGYIAIWDAFNLDAMHEKKVLNLEGMNPHYIAYDKGPCLVACPKDLFSHERTIADGLQAARILAREVYKRNWTVELTGTAKMTRAAWVEIQLLGDQHQRPLDIVNYQPSPKEAQLYTNQSIQLEAKRNMEQGFE